MTHPPRWKMAVLTWIAIYPVITGLLLALGRVILNFPIPVATLILSVTLVLLMTFVVMPLLTRAFRPWLQRHLTAPHIGCHLSVQQFRMLTSLLDSSAAASASPCDSTER